MPHARHTEKHFGASETIRDIVIGMSDGLTVPFALAAGLSGAAAASSIIVIAGLAEIGAGSIAMGLGGYLAARGDAEHYAAELRREQQEILDVPDVETAEVEAVFRSYGLSAREAEPVVRALTSRPQAWVDFMMRFELGLERPNPRRAVISAATIAGAYVLGGLVPLFPYMLTTDPSRALKMSLTVTLAALLVFGYVKGLFSGTTPLRSAIQTLLIGGLAAAAAFGIARLVSAEHL